jgi:hypothetical protein
VIFFAVEWPNVQIDWVGNTRPFDGCDGAGCTRLPIPDSGFFGPVSVSMQLCFITSCDWHRVLASSTRDCGLLSVVYGPIAYNSWFPCKIINTRNLILSLLVIHVHIRFALPLLIFDHSLVCILHWRIINNTLVRKKPST